MKKISSTVKAFFKRSLDRACKLDRGEKLRPETRVIFECEKPPAPPANVPFKKGG